MIRGDDDPYFGKPFIDIDEWRTSPRPHRYVHGGFEGTETLFSIYLPPVEEYERRFVHILQGGTGGSENTALASVLGETDMIDFAASCGAYLVESNQGHKGVTFDFLKMDQTVTSYRASAQSARFAYDYAAKHYGAAPLHGYLLGGSGGGLRAVTCMENVEGLWDGGVPFIAGPCALNGPSIVMNAARLLGPQAASVVDATAPGGSGDPFASLDTEQREALALAYRVGIPRGAEHAFFGSALDIAIGLAILNSLTYCDPAYVSEFWSLPGYAGADGALARSLLDVRTTVRGLVTQRELANNLDVTVTQGFWGKGSPDSPIGLRVDPIDFARVPGSYVTVLSGAEKGQRRQCIATDGHALLVGLGIGEAPLEKIAVGDEIAIDNRDFLAFCYAHRHTVDKPLPSTAPLLSLGRPIYPQRPINQATSMIGVGQTGKFHGKMIFINNAFDTSELATNAADYVPLVKSHFGPEIGDRFRLWFNDNTTHIGPTDAASSTRLISFMGSIQQAIQDLIGWVERDEAPPGDSGFRYTAEEGFNLRLAAEERRGIQPVVTATANGGVRADVSVGEAVTFVAVAEVPPGAGTIVSAEWDFDGRGTWPLKHTEIDGKSTKVTLAAKHTFNRPGTYFPSVRVTSHRQGNVEAVHRRIVNLARVRVVVG